MKHVNIHIYIQYVYICICTYAHTCLIPYVCNRSWQWRQQSAYPSNCNAPWKLPPVSIFLFCINLLSIPPPLPSLRTTQFLALPCECSYALPLGGGGLWECQDLHMYTWIYSFVMTCTYTHAYRRIPVYLHTCMCICICMYLNTYPINMYTHTYL